MYRLGLLLSNQWRTPNFFMGKIMVGLFYNNMVLREIYEMTGLEVIAKVQVLFYRENQSFRFNHNIIPL